MIATCPPWHECSLYNNKIDIRTVYVSLLLSILVHACVCEEDGECQVLEVQGCEERHHQCRLANCLSTGGVWAPLACSSGQAEQSPKWWSTAGGRGTAGSGTNVVVAGLLSGRLWTGSPRVYLSLGTSATWRGEAETSLNGSKGWKREGPPRDLWGFYFFLRFFF